MPELHLQIRLHLRIGHGMWADVLAQSSSSYIFETMMHNGDHITNAKTGKAQDLQYQHTKTLGRKFYEHGKPTQYLTSICNQKCISELVSLMNAQDMNCLYNFQIASLLK